MLDANILYPLLEVRLLRMFRELYLICAGLLESVKTLGWVGLLLFIWVYVFAIFTTQMIGNDPTGVYAESYFIEDVRCSSLSASFD